MTQPLTPQRILLITRNMPPLVGGMERLNWHMADELSKYAEVRIIGPKGAADLKPKLVSLNEAPLKPLPLFLLATFFKSMCIALRWKPDIILAGSGLTTPIAWLTSKLCGARSAAYLHGFDITVKDLLYQNLWTPTFKKVNYIFVNSTPTKHLASAAGIPEKKINIVYPGVSLPEYPQSAAAISAFKQQHGLTNKKILLSVGRLTARKGLKEFVELALPAIVQREPDCILVIVGEAPKNSLGAKIQSEDAIKTQAERAGIAGHIRFLGVITDKSLLATAYEAADIHVFPVRHIPDDPEGFGMVAIEAAAHGLPTVAFSTGGVIDAVEDGVSGYLVSKNSYHEISEQIVKLLNQPLNAKDIQDFAQEYAWLKFGKSLLHAIQATNNGSV